MNLPVASNETYTHTHTARLAVIVKSLVLGIDQMVPGFAGVAYHDFGRKLAMVSWGLLLGSISDKL